MKSFLSQIKPWVRSVSLLGSVSLLSVAGAGWAALFPDLVVSDYTFPNAQPQSVIVTIANQGNAPVGKSILYLEVTQINGTQANRYTRVQVPPIGVNNVVTVNVDASSLLPNTVDLENTRFYLEADFGNNIPEMDELNNRLGHY